MSRKTSLAIPALPLFPFQAVLCCTMGALILILIVINRQSRVKAVALAKAAAEQSQVADVATAAQREALDHQMQQLEQARTQTEMQLGQRRLQLSALESQLRDLKNREESLRETAAQLENSDPAATQRQATQAELAQLQTEIAKAEAEVTAAREKAGQKPRSYAIVPYVGPNQTRRRPIYIECRRDKITLQPEGIELRPADFKGSNGPGNPLAQALRAARERIAEVDQTSLEKLGEPYPLLIVRPDGVVAYYAARDAMRSWGTEFGYEFVEQDWQLKYPPPDPVLVQREQQAVSEARSRMQWAASVAGGTSDNKGPRSTYRAGYGGIVRESGPGNDEQLADDAFSLQSEGKRGRDSFGNPVTALPAGYRGAGGMASVGGGPRGSAGGGSGGPAGDDNILGSSELGGPGGGISGGSGAVAGGSSGNDSILGLGGIGASRGNNKGGENNSVASGAQRTVGSGSSGAPAGASGAAPSSSTGGEDPWASSAPANRANSSAAAGERGPSMGLQDSFMRSDASASGNAGSSNRKLRSLAESRGVNWGLSGPTQKQVAVARPVRIQCSGDHLTMMNDSGTAPVKVIPLAPHTEDSVDDLVLAVREVIKTWGIAGRNMYWRPQLLLEIGPSGEGRFYELQTLLENSGLDVIRRQK